MSRKTTVAIVGAGKFATSLALALKDAGYRITEIVSRDSSASRRHASKLAAKVAARAVTVSEGKVRASLVWLCVPDREIHSVASALTGPRDTRVMSTLRPREPRGKRSSYGPGAIPVTIAFHSSGALASTELAAFKKTGIAVAAVHPLMTFVPGSQPALSGVPFALEGDAAATKLARKIVRDLGGESFSLPASRKAAYHAWATMTSPLLLAFLVTLEEAARIAGINPADARRMSLPIIRQTLTNYARLGPGQAFSGPIIRGDVEVVARHLKALKKSPSTREVYVALARAALRSLPSNNRRLASNLLKQRG